MSGPATQLHFSASSLETYQNESAAVEGLHQNDPSAYAKNPRVIAFFALSQLIKYRITRNLYFYSYPVPKKLVPKELQPLRCAETFGWRLLVRPAADGQSIALIDLSRVSNYRDANLRRTLERIANL
jgi:hypothetical protein